VDIRPKHLNDFYTNLGEPGIRKDSHKAIPKIDITPVIKDRGFTRAKLADAAKVSPMTITATTQGKRINIKMAEAVSAALGEKTETLFTIEAGTEPLSLKTQLEHHRLISTILAQAEKEMIVQYNAARKATPPKVPSKEAKCFQPEEVTAIRDALETEPLKWKVITHLLLVSGCRRGEILGLKWDRIDWNNSQVKIDRSLLYSASQGIYESDTKTSTTRFIKLPHETMALLREYKLWYMELQMLNGDRWKDTGYLFVKDDGTPIHPDTATQWLRRFAERHNLSHIYPHKFRHTMASLLYYAGKDSVTISKRLGHARVSTTQDIYSHLIKEADEQAAESIADSILRPPKGTKKLHFESLVR